MSDQRRPKPDPAAGTVAYGHCVALSIDRHKNPAARKATEDICHTLLEVNTGLKHEWGEWRFEPESDHEDEETGEIVTIPPVWIYTCEALGPEGLTP